jgi:hypothetical protein
MKSLKVKFCLIKLNQILFVHSYNIFILHTYHSCLIAEGVAEVSQIFLQDAHVLLKLLSYEEYYRRVMW